MVRYKKLVSDLSVPNNPLGWSWHLISACAEVGCQGFAGPFPSAFLDKNVVKNWSKGIGQDLYFKIIYLNVASKFIKNHFPGFEPPAYYPGNHYTRAGSMIVLNAGPDYYAKFPGDPKTLFVHHFIKAYLYLADQLKD